jgi:predicted porin
LTRKCLRPKVRCIVLYMAGTVYSGIGGVNMQRLVLSAVASAALFLGGAGAVYAADMAPVVTKAPEVTAPLPPAACTSIQDFFLTGCQLSWYGVRFFGTVDVGGGYQTNGAPFNGNFVTGASYFIQKMNRSSMWGLAPNGLSQSSIGVQIREPLAADWSFVAQLEAGFDPYSLRFANSPESEVNNIGVPVNQQSTNGDSSRAGQFYNSQGFLGVSSETYGTLTVFRQNALTLDGVLAYDPMGGAYAFSPIGFSGVVAGGGDTENAKFSTSVKYRLNIGDYRLAALWQFGGYSLNNGSDGAYEAQLGGDFHNFGPGPLSGTLSLDAIFDYARDAVNLSLAGAPTNAAGLPTGTMLPQTQTATLSDNTSVMLLAKYTVDRLKLYAGYEWMQFAPPSDPFSVPHTGFTDIAGDFICFECNTATGGTNINSLQYSAPGNSDKVLQVVWLGAKYAIAENLDVIGAWYHYNQNNYTTDSCANPTAHATCPGTMDAFSAVIDWRFLPKWDTYIGTMFSQMNGGLDNGFLARSNLATTAGLRFRF